MGRGVREGGRVGWLGGVTNIGARFLGGWLSDWVGGREGRREGGRAGSREGAGGEEEEGGVRREGKEGGRAVRGRMLVLFSLLLAEGAFLLGFSYVTGGGREGGREGGRAYAWACVLVVLFSSCVQAASGAVFALVPYLSKRRGGASVAGFVGGGGGVGAVLFTLLFMWVDREGGREGREGGRAGFRVMGWVVLVGASVVWLLDPRKLEEGHREVEEVGREEGEGGGGVSECGVVVGPEEAGGGREEGVVEGGREEGV